MRRPARAAPDARAAAVLLVAVPALVTNWRTQRAAAAAVSWAAQSGPMSDRWKSAVTMLAHGDPVGSSSVEARLGAIYSIEQIARESPTYRVPAMELLAAYVREHSQAGRGGLEPTTEVQSILTELGRSGHEGLDLRRTALWGVDLSGASLGPAVVSRDHIWLPMVGRPATGRRATR